MHCAVPDGVQGGQAIQVPTPYGLAKVMVPAGLQPGHMFAFAMGPPLQPPSIRQPPMPALQQLPMPPPETKQPKRTAPQQPMPPPKRQM